MISRAYLQSKYTRTVVFLVFHLENEPSLIKVFLIRNMAISRDNALGNKDTVMPREAASLPNQILLCMGPPFIGGSEEEVVEISSQICILVSITPIRVLNLVHSL